MGGVTIRHKGVPVSSDKECILHFFSKKARGITVKAYNFSLALELNLVIENKLFQEVLLHLESDIPDAGTPEVSEDLTHSCEQSAHL